MELRGRWATADRRNQAKKRRTGVEVSKKGPWNLTLQFQRGLRDGDWELEERATKMSCGAGRVSVYNGADPMAKTEISAERFDPVGVRLWCRERSREGG